jgi:methylmalonyl-CoA/ethylmalonyl-CoA epimerase
MNFTDLTFHHVGIACRSIEDEKKYYQSLGYRQEGEFFTDPLQKISGIFMILGSMRIELLEATVKDSPLHSFLNRGIHMYHQAFLCPDLPGVIENFLLEGAVLVVDPIPAVAFNGRKISFLMLRNKLLVELIETVN